eukprot:1160418-Pelagomonas_calceolata.AAC.12
MDSRFYRRTSRTHAVRLRDCTLMLLSVRTLLHLQIADPAWWEDLWRMLLAMISSHHVLIAVYLSLHVSPPHGCQHIGVENALTHAHHGCTLLAVPDY